MPTMSVDPPQWLEELPREGRGYIVPAETPWLETGPSLSKYDPLRTLLLAAYRACAVCGVEMDSQETVWRVFAQKDAAICRLDGEQTDERSAPGHLVCMLYSSLVCPFWKTRNARLGKDSVLEPGASRGTRPALMEYADFQLLLRSGLPIAGPGAQLPHFAYVGRRADVPFREPAELAERYELELRESQPDGNRHYWSLDDVGKLAQELSDLNRALQRTAPVRMVDLRGEPRLALSLPIEI